MRGGFSETESEHSKGDRDSTEIKTAHTLPLAKPPEKGILKKHPRSAENPRRTRSRDVERLVAKRDSSITNQYDIKSDPKNVAGNADRRFLLEARNRVSDAADGGNTAKSQTANCPADKCSSDDGLEFIDDEGDDESVGSCSSEEDEVSPSVSDGLKNDSEFDPSQSYATVGGEKSPQRELQAFYVTAAVDEHKKKLRKNITDLLKQFDEFDEQFNSVLSRTAVSPADMSPSNSLEYHAKEANAKEEHVPNGILPQKETDPATPNNRTYSKYDTNSRVDIQDKHLTGLPDLLDSGIQKLSLKSAETVRNNLAAKPLVLPQKENEVDSDHSRNVKQNGLSSSGTTPNLVVPVSKAVLPTPRTQFYTSLATPFTAKATNSESFRKPAKAEDIRNKSAEVKPDASDAVPYCEATTSESPRLNQHKLFQPDIHQNRSDGNSKPTCNATRPSDISMSVNKQSIGSATNSDRANASDEAIVIREIPVSREYPFASSSRGNSTKAPVVLSSPEDVDV